MKRFVNGTAATAYLLGALGLGLASAPASANPLPSWYDRMPNAPAKVAYFPTKRVQTAALPSWYDRGVSRPDTEVGPVRVQFAARAFLPGWYHRMPNAPALRDYGVMVAEGGEADETK